MKHKITRRLIGYFTIVLLLFSFTVGILFYFLFTWNTAKIQEQELKARAVSIAGTLSGFPSHKGRGPGNGGGYGAYLRFLDEIAMSEVWLVDEHAQKISTGTKRSSLSYSELPEGAKKLIHQVFLGNIATDKNFPITHGTPSVTVGAPITDPDGNIVAAILLHSPISGIDQARKDGILILVFSIGFAFFLGILLSVLFAHHFVWPLKKMKETTENIMKGNYSAITTITQKDEIGLLASNIDQLSVQLSHAEQERQKLDQMRQDFISNISHELRTPVTVLKGSLEVLDQGLITDSREMQEYFHQMLADTAHLQRLVNDLLELSRLQNPDFPIEKTKVNLADTLTDAIHAIQKISSAKQVTILLENEPKPVPFFGDYGRLRQLFTIILDNAVKFSPPEDSVLVCMQRHEKECVISITDHGTGISPEEIPLLFHRFYREHSEQNKSGSGLGLSIAKQIADRHDIGIQCQSAPGKETTFLLIFPI